MRATIAASSRGAVTRGDSGRLSRPVQSIATNSTPGGSDDRPCCRFDDALRDDPSGRLRRTRRRRCLRGGRRGPPRGGGARPKRARASRFDTATAGLPVASAKPFTHASPTRTPVNEPGPEAAAKHEMSPSVTRFRSSSSRSAAVQHLAEARGRGDRHFLDRLPAARQREAPVLAGGVDRQDQGRHCFTSSALSNSYTFPLAFMPYSRRCMVAG